MSMARLIDANTNRAVEGLRVLEDVARFVFDRAELSESAKRMRHELRGLGAQAVTDRDTPGDVGTQISAADEMQRPDLAAVIRANGARVQEALRALEEAWKLSDAAAAASCEQLRYGCYTLEADLLARLPCERFRAIKLYVLIDMGCTDEPLKICEAALAGGAQAIQLRAKGMSAREYLELSVKMLDLCRSADVPFVVNDHVDIAAAIGADAIHVGQEDLPIAAVRKRAKQFEFQKEAVSFLKVPTCLAWSNLGRSRPILA